MEGMEIWIRIMKPARNKMWKLYKNTMKCDNKSENNILKIIGDL